MLHSLVFAVRLLDDVLIHQAEGVSPDDELNSDSFGHNPLNISVKG